MSELSPRGRALFEAGRRSLQPSAADRERVFAALSARLGAPEPNGHDAPSMTPGASGLGWPKLGAWVVGLALGGAGLFQVLRVTVHAAHPTVTTSAPLASVRSAPASPSLPMSATPLPSVESTPSATPEPAHAGGRPSASAQASDRLAEEVAILSQAERALHAGQYREALSALDEHHRKFPNGTLAQERRAARVQALCGLGRVSDAQAELARLTRLAPRSPHEGRAREACATHD